MTYSEKILIVEDDAIIATFISRILKSHGYSVTLTGRGKDALEKIQTSHYNLILLDIRLPDIDGTEILKKIRETNHEIIVIMITGHPHLETSIDSINHGADGYLIKPVRDKDLIDMVEEKLKQRFICWVSNPFV